MVSCRAKHRRLLGAAAAGLVGAGRGGLLGLLLGLAAAAEDQLHIIARLSHDHALLNNLGKIS